MSNQNNSGGAGVVGLLGVVFVVLKLCGVIHWSWWRVTVPFWGGLAMMLAIVIVTIVVAGIVKLIFG